MHAQQAIGFQIAHRIAYRVAQGALVYWVMSACFGEIGDLPTRLDLLVTGAFALLILWLPRPRRVEPVRRPVLLRGLPRFLI